MVVVQHLKPALVSLGKYFFFLSPQQNTNVFYPVMLRTKLILQYADHTVTMNARTASVLRQKYVVVPSDTNSLKEYVNPTVKEDANMALV